MRHLAAWSVTWLLAAAALAAAGSLPLLEAVKSRDAAEVRRLLAAGADVTERWGDGATALHWAAVRQDIEMADLLLAAGADPGAANDHGVTPLALACTNGDTALVRRLLAAGADPDAATSMGESALMTCARGGDAEAVAVLLRHGATDVNARERTRGQTALMWAAGHRHSDVVRVLLAHGADVHARSIVTHLRVPTNAYASRISRRDVVDMPLGGFTPLLFAARHGDVEVRAAAAGSRRGRERHGGRRHQRPGSGHAQRSF